MKWDEFRAFLEGMAPETPLGRIVSIRAETDEEILKHFSPEQKRIQGDWLRKTAKGRKPEEVGKILDELKNAFIEAAGGIKNCKEKGKV